MKSEFTQLYNHIRKRIDISDQEFEWYTGMLQVVTLRKKDFFSRAGETCRTQAYVNRGCMVTYFTDDKAHNHVVQIGVEDWWVGDVASFLSGTPTLYNVEALEDSELFVIDSQKMEEVYFKLPRFERFNRILVQNAYISFQRRVIESMSKSAEERYLDFTKKYPLIRNRVAQHLIASYLGITPEALSRIKKTMIERQRSGS